MTTRSTKTTRTKGLQVEQVDDRDAETRALWESPQFQAILERSRASAAERTYTTEELEQEFGITEKDKALAREYLDALDQLEEEQGEEVTGSQASVLELVVTAGQYLRGEGTLAEMAEDTAIPEAEIRAAAVALNRLGLPDTRCTEAAEQDAPALAQPPGP